MLQIFYFEVQNSFPVYIYAIDENLSMLCCAITEMNDVINESMFTHLFIYIRSLYVLLSYSLVVDDYIGTILWNIELFL